MEGGDEEYGVNGRLLKSFYVNSRACVKVGGC